jgi:hypothetical protein
MMDIELLQKRFAEMGARVKVREAPPAPWQWGRRARRPGLDIRRDARGEYFDVGLPAGERVEYEVVDLRPELRHLLLLARGGRGKEKFLCGHDERHWFVCAVPGDSVASVARKVRRQKLRLRRRNEAFVRQGEWFFLPAPEGFAVDSRLVLHNEPLRRGAGSKPHTCQFLYRSGGETVWVSRRAPDGLTEGEYRQLLLTTPRARDWGWRVMRRNPEVYARGSVRHADHRTVVLGGWHRVMMNTEQAAAGNAQVVFLD